MSLLFQPLKATRPIGQYLFERIVIKGTTNVNKFQIVYSDDDFSYFSTKDTSKNSNLKMALPTGKFVATPEAMLKDFLDIIEAKKFPFIYIAIKDNLTKSFFENNSHFFPNVAVTIRGVSNVYTCESELENSYYNEWYFNGMLKLKLSDFGIDPPEKFLGLIRVKDEVQINFKILFVLE